MLNSPANGTCAGGLECLPGPLAWLVNKFSTRCCTRLKQPSGTETLVPSAGLFNIFGNGSSFFDFIWELKGKTVWYGPPACVTSAYAACSQVDIQAEELGNNVRSAVSLHGDIKAVTQQVSLHISSFPIRFSIKYPVFLNNNHEENKFYWSRFFSWYYHCNQQYICWSHVSFIIIIMSSITLTKWCVPICICIVLLWLNDVYQFAY